MVIDKAESAEGQAIRANERARCIAVIETLGVDLRRAHEEASLRPDTGPPVKVLDFLDGITMAALALRSST